jgi:CheY-like chemotaxis protein
VIAENIRIVQRMSPETGSVMADAAQMHQMLMNLVVNARDAMLQGGKLTIKTGCATLDEDEAQAHPGAKAGDYVVLSVTDTGTGMSAEVKARLFEAFFTTKAEGKGTGLGLVTCQTIIRQSGGHVEVISEPGKGTTFNIFFPQVERGTPLPADAPEKSGTGRGGTETLLIVEDDPALRHLAQGVLRGRGYTILTAPNGQDALRVAREHRGPPLALVITDVIMPRMGGKVMAEWLKITYPGLKVLFTSGYTEDAIVDQGVLEREIEFLPKPYSPASLAAKVRDLLDH